MKIPPKGSKTKSAKKTYLQVIEPCELLPFLISQIPNKSRNNIKSLLSRQQVALDGEIVTRFDHPLQQGQTVVVDWAIIEEPPQGIKILFEDQDIIVIEKEVGILSVATAKERDLTAYSILSEHIKKENPKNKIFVVHRLDRDTSGVMMFAKSEKIQQLLQNNWKEVVLERLYMVVVEGKLLRQEGTVTSWLKESSSLIVSSSRTPNGGVKAVTHYKLLDSNANFSLLEVSLETGRKNQIRVHLKDLGHSVVGDKKYGSTKNPIHRLGLHARVLAFKHPGTGEIVRIESAIPEEFLRLFNTNRKTT